MSVEGVSKQTKYKPNLYFIVRTEKMTKKKPRFGAIPTINMPRKRHETPKPSPRAPVNRTAITDESTQRPRSCYKTLNDFNHLIIRKVPLMLLCT